MLSVTVQNGMRSFGRLTEVLRKPNLWETDPTNFEIQQKKLIIQLLETYGELTEPNQF